MNKLKTFDGFEKWVRPTPENRAFYSPELDDYLGEISQKISNVEIRHLMLHSPTHLVILSLRERVF